MREFLHKIILGIGFGIGAVIFIVGGDKVYDRFTVYTPNYGDVSNFSLTPPYEVKSGKYLILTGEIVGNDLQEAKDFSIRANVKLKENFIENCYGDTHNSLDNIEKWYYIVECMNIEKGYFDLPYDYSIYIENVILKDR